MLIAYVWILNRRYIFKKVIRISILASLFTSCSSKSYLDTNNNFTTVKTKAVKTKAVKTLKYVESTAMFEDVNYGKFYQLTYPVNKNTGIIFGVAEK